MEQLNERIRSIGSSREPQDEYGPKQDWSIRFRLPTEQQKGKVEHFATASDAVIAVVAAVIFTVVIILLIIAICCFPRRSFRWLTIAPAAYGAPVPIAKVAKPFTKDDLVGEYDLGASSVEQWTSIGWMIFRADGWYSCRLGDTLWLGLWQMKDGVVYVEEVWRHDDGTDSTPLKWKFAVPVRAKNQKHWNQWYVKTVGGWYTTLKLKRKSGPKM